MFILDDLLIGLPVKGFKSILRTIADMAEEELTDESKIKEELLMLQTLFVTDQITEEEYQSREDELVARLSLAEEGESEL
ncbi:hypothetical protein KDW_06200 [Dictyobacter vulcani]|uniref:Gas vesicle protein GvpG n=1 Tax=Dictyobacter vulcani TaxID=2607529 RepID=A0A5J4KCI1_9CHLR|nr:gas vesicle protein GvpG [Dictyobacter vulcani]GER86458.1 hypothetical protein KDW_06200 [Dictyobacter vulcani]